MAIAYIARFTNIAFKTCPFKKLPKNQVTTIFEIVSGKKTILDIITFYRYICKIRILISLLGRSLLS